MYLLKLQMHKHENSIYFTRDNMVCFPKSSHKYIALKTCSKQLKYSGVTNDAALPFP